MHANTPPHPTHININEDDHHHQHQQQNKQNDNGSSLSPLRRYLTVLHKARSDHTSSSPTALSSTENEIKDQYQLKEDCYQVMIIETINICINYHHLTNNGMILSIEYQ